MNSDKFVNILITFTITMVLVLAFNSAKTFVAKENTKELITLLYDFGSVDEIDRRKTKVAKMTTKEVYNQVYSMDRTLNAYLKLKGAPASVRFLEEKSNYITFEIVSESLTEGRVFMVMYNINMQGKVSKFRELEVIDFI